MAPATKIVVFEGQRYAFPAAATDKEIAAALESATVNPWTSVGRVASIAFGIPLAVLALGASLVWAFSGFAATRP